MSGVVEIKCRGAENIDITDIKPFQGNLKDLRKEDYNRLRKEILELGFSEPISVWRDPDGVVHALNGHQRLRVLTELRNAEGFDVPPVPVSLVEASSWREARKKVLSLTSQFGRITSQGLYEFAVESEITVDEIIESFRFPEIDLPRFKAEFFDSVGSDSRSIAPPVPAIPKTKAGDVWTLGRHRLVCGDSTSPETMALLMNGERVDMVFTDPPYNIAYEGGSKKREAIENDSMSGGEFYGFLLAAYKNMRTAMKPGASVYVCHADTERVNFTKAFIDAGFHLNSVVIWAKNKSTFGPQDYFWKHEPILYGWDTEGPHSWHGPNNEDTVWNIDRPSKSDEHPTMKPVNLIERAINNSTAGTASVLDPFGGSGSTLIACEHTGRSCFTIELEPGYCDVILQRWAEATSADPIRHDSIAWSKI